MTTIKKREDRSSRTYPFGEKKGRLQFLKGERKRAGKGKKTGLLPLYYFRRRVEENHPQRRSEGGGGIPCGIISTYPRGERTAPEHTLNNLYI